MNKVLLVYDTSPGPNIGCQATSNGLLGLVKRNLSQDVTSYYQEDVLSLNSLVFSSLTVQDGVLVAFFRLWGRVLRRRRMQQTRVLGTNSLNLALERLARHEPLVAHLRQADMVVVNGEGAIHHHRLTAWTLLCIGSLAKRFGKRVLLANSTIQSMGLPTARRMLGNMDHIWVRDWFSHLYLEKLGISHTLAADCAAVAAYEVSELAVAQRTDKVLLTAGVSARTDFVERLVSKLKSDGHEVSYLSIDKADLVHRRKLEHQGIPIVDAADIGWAKMVSLVGTYALLISGRHHINIFAILSGTPLIPIGSNSWKIRGTLALCGLDTELLDSRGLASLHLRINRARCSSAQLVFARDKLQWFAERHFDGDV